MLVLVGGVVGFCDGLGEWLFMLWGCVGGGVSGCDWCRLLVVVVYE